MKYRNWQEICRIEDPAVRLGLALLDTESEVGARIVEAFPECFGDDPGALPSGPVPLSALMFWAKREKGQYREKADQELFSSGALEEFNLEHYRFSTGLVNGLPALPPEVDFNQLRFGRVVALSDESVFAAEVCETTEVVTFIPVDQVHIDVPGYPRA